MTTIDMVRKIRRLKSETAAMVVLEHALKKLLMKKTEPATEVPCGGGLSDDDPKRYVRDLEAFMLVVAKKLKCLPSYADPAPDEGNSHIVEKLDELLSEAGR